MTFRGAEIDVKVDEKSRLIIPKEIVETKGIGEFVEVVNSEVRGHLITRVYYHDSGIGRALKVKISKSGSSFRITLVKSIREKSFSFFYGNHVLVVDKGKYLEILPWPVC
jgi:bifunctional DNA-binding transcriptional regulator/antitoxin component of YhaV-PrlF toxin-antitoxin module